jgi:hypothetical protein
MRLCMNDREDRTEADKKETTREKRRQKKGRREGRREGGRRAGGPVSAYLVPKKGPLPLLKDVHEPRGKYASHVRLPLSPPASLSFPF